VSAGGGGVIGATEITQKLNNGLLIPINVSSGATAFSTNLDAVKNTVLDPIASGLITNNLQTQIDTVLSWVNGGFEGGSSLIVADPTEYLKDVELNEARKIINLIPENSPFAASVFNSLTSQYKVSSTQNEINQALASSLPKIVRENNCNDRALTRLSIERLGVNYTADDLHREKQALYNYICTGDINNPSVNKKLFDLASQRPDLTGDDGWLAIISGENQFTKTLKVQQIAAEQVDKKVDEKRSDIYFGLNAKSETKCLAFEEDVAGNSFCTKEVIINPSESVQAALSEALTSPFARLQNIDEAGSLSSLFGSMISGFLTKGINEVFSSSNNSGVSTVTTNNIIPDEQDLASDVERKKALLQPIIKKFNYDKKDAEELLETLTDYDIEVNLYSNRIENVRTCYNSLVNNNYITRGDGRYSQAMSYYNNRKSQLDNRRSDAASERARANDALTLISDTRSKIEQSNSSREIDRLFSEYTNIYEVGELPTQGIVASRKVKLNEDRGNAKEDTEDAAFLEVCRNIEATSVSNNSNF
jgi:hypothetical protein